MARKLTKKALRYGAFVVIDDVYWEGLRELLMRKYGGRVGKLLLSGLKRFVYQLETLAQWYGVPYRFRRLYSRKPSVRAQTNTTKGKNHGMQKLRTRGTKRQGTNTLGNKTPQIDKY